MTKQSKPRKILKTSLVYVLMIAIACGMALCYQIFIFENSFAPAGINGIATMIQYKLNFSVAYMSLLINIPLCVLAFLFLDKGFAARSTVFALTFSVALLLLQFRVIDLSFLSYKTSNGTSTILAPIASGVINGIIYGAAIRLNGCTGGTDIVAALIHKKWPEQNLVWIIFAMNTGVAIASYFVYDLKVEPVVLCIIYSFLTSQVSDTILRGSRQRIKFEIVSHESEAISKEIITELKHSVTVVPAKGMFSGQETEMLICVVQKHQVVAMEKIIAAHPGAFAYSTVINETLGNFEKIRYNVFENLKKK